MLEQYRQATGHVMVAELLRQPQASTDRGTPRYSSAAVPPSNCYLD
jgi:hypothetical protein